ncbi:MULTISPECIES: hypothetical protein [Nitrosomonas]|nr:MULTISPECIES: hypothetical protein [Nitrosomonas]
MHKIRSDIIMAISRYAHVIPSHDKLSRLFGTIYPMCADALPWGITLTP